MIRTIALKVYPNTSYTTPLTDATNNAVRMLYASIAGGNFIVGGVVPGTEFEHAGEGVWERTVDTSLMDDNRTDYYYIQYRIKSGTWGEWEDITGFDPFFFNTKVLSATTPVDPSIASLIPSPMTVAENAMSIILTSPCTYTNTGAIPIGCLFEIDVATPGALNSIQIAAYHAAPETLTWSSIRSNDVRSVVHRVGDNYAEGCQLFYRYRIYNPVTMQYSADAPMVNYAMLYPSAQEIIDYSTLDPMPTMMAGDVSEVDSWGTKDSITILTPQLGKGTSVSVAVQFGGVKPTISAGALVGFSGSEVSTGLANIIIPKPVTITRALNVYVARKRVGLTASGDWVGATVDTFYELAVSAPDRLTLLSTEVLSAIADHVASTLQTADATSLERKT